MSKKNKRDYYEILKINKNAKKSEIKQAFRKLAKEYHPDVSSDPNANEKFKEINEAYQVLFDDQKRQNYDRFGHQGVQFEGQSDFGSFSDIFKDINFSDIFSGFSNMFEQGQEHHHQRYKDTDVYEELELTFREAMHGVEKTIKWVKDELCKNCEGTGANSRDDLIKCLVCNGKGEEVIRKNTIFGMINQTRACNKCYGSGYIVRKVCKVCQGKKIIVTNSELKINIPKGADNGATFKLNSKGKINPTNLKQGNLFLEITVKQSEIFKREGNDLLTQVPVSYLIAILGGEIEIPTIDGIKLIDLPAHTQNNKIIRLRNFGSYSLEDQKQRGHQYIKIKIVYPDKISKNEKDSLKILLKETDFEPNKDYIKDIRKSIFFKA